MSNNEFNLSWKIVRVTSNTHASNATFLVEPKAQRINLNRISSGTINGFMCMWEMRELTQDVQTGHVAFWHTLRRIHERQFVSICCVRVCAVRTPCNRLWHSSQLSNIMLSNNIMQNFSLIIPKVQYCTRRHRLNPFSYQKCSAKCSNKIRWESISRSGAGTTIANEIWGELRLCTLQPPETPIFPLSHLPSSNCAPPTEWNGATKVFNSMFFCCCPSAALVLLVERFTNCSLHFFGRRNSDIQRNKLNGTHLPRVPWPKLMKTNITRWKSTTRETIKCEWAKFVSHSLAFLLGGIAELAGERFATFFFPFYSYNTILHLYRSRGCLCFFFLLVAVCLTSRTEDRANASSVDEILFARANNEWWNKSSLAT